MVLEYIVCLIVHSGTFSLVRIYHIVGSVGLCFVLLCSVMPLGPMGLLWL